MIADFITKEAFDEHNTNVLNIADRNITSGIDQITHVVLDGDRLIPYMGNPELNNDFQDDEYEQLIVDDPDIQDEIIDAIRDLL